MRVRIVLKQDQSSGKLTEGILKDILTSSSTHPHGIKVRLVTGAVGRVQEIAGQNFPPESRSSDPGTKSTLPEC